MNRDVPGLHGLGADEHLLAQVGCDQGRVRDHLRADRDDDRDLAHDPEPPSRFRGLAFLGGRPAGDGRGGWNLVLANDRVERLGVDDGADREGLLVEGRDVHDQDRFTHDIILSHSR